MKHLVVSLAAVLFLSGTLNSRERNVGITVFYGDLSSIGISRKVSPRVVLRPTFGFDNTKRKFAFETSHLNFVLSIDLLIHAADSSSVTTFRPYIGTGVSFFYDEMRFEVVPPSRSVSRRMNLRGLVGARHSLSEHFSFFGEAGFSLGDNPSLDGTNFNFSSLARLGLNLNF